MEYMHYTLGYTVLYEISRYVPICIINNVWDIAMKGKIWCLLLMSS
jgi:hypothetical protein